ncbi:hypothetical protein Poly24_08690 [Rosistilla carotiformis]|uniref:Uncharacterized protein n=1 Tax=Rosistilla carotiformis TaxID=2528017 RepID=A0A518JNQ2_9BACT|nr:hypothetical protein Poly24_08690 [Rosistilla carotiformis]
MPTSIATMIAMHIGLFDLGGIFLGQLSVG